MLAHNSRLDAVKVKIGDSGTKTWRKLGRTQCKKKKPPIEERIEYQGKGPGAAPSSHRKKVRVRVSNTQEKSTEMQFHDL